LEKYKNKKTTKKKRENHWNKALEVTNICARESPDTRPIRKSNLLKEKNVVDQPANISQ